jgi:hypothetical protein
MTEPQAISPADYHRLTRRPKFGNRRTEVDGITFASAREAARYRDLCLMQAAGEIADLTLQPTWVLVVNGLRVGRYSADFAYTDRRTGQLVVEDVKGGEATKTQAYQLRKKLLLACHGLQVTEV